MVGERDAGLAAGLARLVELGGDTAVNVEAAALGLLQIGDDEVLEAALLRFEDRRVERVALGQEIAIAASRPGLPVAL